MKKLLLLLLLVSLCSSAFSADVVTRDNARHEMVNGKIEKQARYDILMPGDSITHLLDEPKHLNPKWIGQSGKNFEYYTKQLKAKTI